MALTACADSIQFRVPPLNEADRAHLTCAEYPEIRETLLQLPAHVFLSGSNGQAVVTPDGHKWVRFDVVNRREAMLIRFGDVAGRTSHEECAADLEWLGHVWQQLEG